jgi:hypothetical protein
LCKYFLNFWAFYTGGRPLPSSGDSLARLNCGSHNLSGADTSSPLTHFP